MKILILGQSGGLASFRDGMNAKHVMNWFKAKSFEEFQTFAKLMTVREKHEDKSVSLPHMSDISTALREADIVFLIGRYAQSLIEAYHRHCFKPLWREEKYVGLPHPASKVLSNNEIQEYIDEVLKCL